MPRGMPASTWGGATSWPWRSPGRSRASAAPWTCSAGSTGWRPARSRLRRSASLAPAVALLGRNTALGVGLSALLFGALLTGTSQRNLDPSIFKPELAGNLTQIIQGLVVLFVGADLLILAVWNYRKKLSRAAPPDTTPEPEPAG